MDNSVNSELHIQGVRINKRNIFQANNQQVAVDMCLQKNKMPFMNFKECLTGFHGNSSSQGQGSTKVILPYPSPETYFVGARLLCFKSVTIANKRYLSTLSCQLC